MIDRFQWAFAEADLRHAEDRRFPIDITPDHPDWRKFAKMKGERARRRKARKYSRATANALVAWAEQQDRRAAA